MFRIALALTPVLFLTYLLRFQISGIPTNILEVYTGILFIWWTANSIFVRRDAIHRVFRRNRKILVATTLFLASATVALVVTLTKLPPEFMKVPLGIWKGWVVLPVLFFVMTITTFRKKSDLELITNTCVLAAGAYAFLACLQYFTQILPGPAMTYDQRLVWPFFDPLTFEGSSGNYPALFLGPILTLTVLKLWNFIRSKKQNTLKISVFSASIVFMAFAVFLTKSFAAWIAILGSVMLGIFIEIRSRKKWVIPVVGIVAILGIALTQMNTEKFQSAFDLTGDSSTAERLRTYRVAGQMIAQDPLFGPGIGQFQRAFERTAPEVLSRPVSQKEIDHALHAHNIFLMVYTSFGLAGLLTFLYLIFTALRITVFPQRIAYLMPLVCILIHGLFDVPYFKNDLAYEFWLILALITVVRSVPYSTTVSVVSGMGLATKLGFPTVNLALPKNTKIPYGVYLASATFNGNTENGVLAFGKRLTQNLNEETCEIHLLHPQHLPSDTLTLNIYQKLRSWKKFGSTEELKKAIARDVQLAGRNNQNPE
jgi:hypothetical protein